MTHKRFPLKLSSSTGSTLVLHIYCFLLEDMFPHNQGLRPFPQSAHVPITELAQGKKKQPEDTTFSVPSSFTALSTMLWTVSSTWCNRKANRSAKVVASFMENLTWLGRKKKGRTDSIYINGSFYLMARGLNQS